MTEKSLEEQLRESQESRTVLATHIAGMQARFEDEMHAHLIDAWMKGHNAGFWNGRKSMDGYDPDGARRTAALEAGLIACPFITTPEELEMVRLKYSVPEVREEEQDGDS